MKSYLLLVASVLGLFCSAHAAEKKDEGQKEEGRYGAKPLKGDYYEYGGTLSEMLPPTPKDRKVAFMFTSALAKELFDKIGPDTKDSCTSAADYRQRNRGDLFCTYTKNDGYSCYFGLNVVTGKSTYGAIC